MHSTHIIAYFTYPQVYYIYIYRYTYYPSPSSSKFTASHLPTLPIIFFTDKDNDEQLHSTCSKVAHITDSSWLPHRTIYTHFFSYPSSIIIIIILRLSSSCANYTTNYREKRSYKKKRWVNSLDTITSMVINMMMMTMIT